MRDPSIIAHVGNVLLAFIIRTLLFICHHDLLCIFFMNKNDHYQASINLT